MRRWKASAAPNAMSLLQFELISAIALFCQKIVTHIAVPVFGAALGA
jgi:hypothetical protein